MELELELELEFGIGILYYNFNIVWLSIRFCSTSYTFCNTEGHVCEQGSTFLDENPHSCDPRSIEPGTSQLLSQNACTATYFVNTVAPANGLHHWLPELLQNEYVFFQ